MTYAYMSDFSVRRFLGYQDSDQFLKTPIARIETMRGNVQRQKASDYEFTTLPPEAPLFPNDSVMTGPDSAITIVTNDGEKFELGPNSLVKLVFDYDFASGGVVQKLKLKPLVVQQPKIVVQKNIVIPRVVIRPVEQVVEKKKPIHVAMIQPAQGAEFSFSPDEYARKSKKIKLVFSFDREIVNLNVHVLMVTSQGKKDLGYFSPTTNGLNGEVNIEVSHAAQYVWRVRGGEGEGRVLAESNFKINRYIELIKNLPVLGNKNTLDGYSTKKEFDGLSIRWEPIDGYGNYTVRVRTTSGQQVLHKSTPKTVLTITGKQVQQGKFEYYVERSVKNGFIAKSNVLTFGFEFLPPEPVSPAQNTKFDKSTLEKTVNNIFFTWSKTNFTEMYDFEIASDPSFSTIVGSYRIKDNVKSVQAPPDGQYFWRVRSISGKKISAPSQPFSFTVAR